MTEYELIEVIGLYSSNAGSFFAVYLTVITGYLLTAFMAGSRLGSLQVVILSIGFIVAACVVSFSSYSALTSRYYYVELLLDLNPKSPQASNPWVMHTLGVLMVGGIIAALCFMWTVRHPKTE